MSVNAGTRYSLASRPGACPCAHVPSLTALVLPVAERGALCLQGRNVARSPSHPLILLPLGQRQCCGAIPVWKIPCAALRAVIPAFVKTDGL